MKTITASRPMARVSLRDSVIIFNNIRNKQVKKAKSLLDDLINQKRNIGGKYYTGPSKVILALIEEAENNADSKEMDREKLYVKEATANKSFRYMLPKSRFSHRGRKAKICQLKITLGER